MQRYFTKIKDNNTFILSNEDMYHITRVMRMKVNDKVEVVYDKEVYLCNLDINNNINILNSLKTENIDCKEIVLILPLLKEQKMDFVLQKATELGVNTIIPVKTERSIVKLDNEKYDKKIERWTKICKEAAEQSFRNTIPNVQNIVNLKELNDIDGLKIICSTTEKDNTLKKHLNNHPNYDKIVIVIGPEGGLSPNEELLLENYNFCKVTLGNRIMRVETVPIFLLSILNYEFME